MLKKLAILVIILLFSFSENIFANERDFNNIAKLYSSQVVKGYKYTSAGDFGAIIFKENSNFPDYFTTGDKINKIFAIESARMFRKVPGMLSLGIQIVADGKDLRMAISRRQIETWYEMKFKGMNDEDWKKFIKKNDNKKARLAFRMKFVKLTR